MGANIADIGVILKSSLNVDQQFKWIIEMCLLLEMVAKIKSGPKIDNFLCILSNFGTQK